MAGRTLTLEAWAGPAEEGASSRWSAGQAGWGTRLWASLWSAVMMLSTEPEVQEALLLRPQGSLGASGGA